MHTVYGQPEENPAVFAANWGWNNASTDWQALVKSPEIGLVDIVTPNFMHAPPARAALEAGKAVACEKPIAGRCRRPEMAVNRENRISRSSFGTITAAVCAFAHKLKEGRWDDSARAAYLQWAPNRFPCLRLRIVGGSGARRSERAYRRYDAFRHR
jgi:hypothetical protein